MPTLKQKTINGMLWSVGERLSMQVALMVTSIIMARLLDPADFGLLGMLSIFTAVAQSIVSSGFGTALIQKSDSSQIDASSVFFINLLLGAFLAGVLFFSAPLIATFYNQPILIPITRVISFNLIINSFSLVQVSLLTKNMNFKGQFKVGLVSVVFSGIIGITMALMGLGVWSLVTQLTVRYIVNAVMLWFVSPWRPTTEFSFQSIRTLFTFSSRMLIAGLISTIFNNIYQTFIGRVFSPSDLGYYNKAQTLEQAATQSTSFSLQKVTFPAFVALQDDDSVLKDSYRKTIKLSMFFNSPLMIGLIVIADPLIRILLTDKWAPSIPFFQLFCVIGLLFPLDSFNGNIRITKGRSDLALKVQVLRKTIVIIAIAITYRWGIIALIYGQMLTAIINFVIDGYYSDRLIGYSISDQIKDILPSIIIAASMALLVFLIGTIQTRNLVIDLMVKITSGILYYCLINYLINSRELQEIIVIIKNTILLVLKKA